MKTIKFLKPNDPRMFDDFNEDFVRKEFVVESIEQLDGDPSAYFVLKFRDAMSPKLKNYRVIVKHKNFFREHFANYNDAMEVINRVKDKLWSVL